MQINYLIWRVNMSDISNFEFKKKFGQNFLKDNNVLNNIVEKSDIEEETLVIEIGVGAGYLTKYIASKAKYVIGFEIDESLKAIIYNNLKDFNNVEIVYEDFLKANVIEILKKYDYKNVYVIANLPYYITTPIIEKIIDLNIAERLVVMVQKEVGDRFNAKIGTKEYNSLTLYLNYYFKISKVMDVSRNSFIPKPNVDSAVIRFDRYYRDDCKSENKLFSLIRDSFQFKRKNLRNNLKGYNLESIEKTLNKYGKDLTVRAENLSLEEFIDISNNLEG